MSRLLERVAIVLVALAISIGVIALLSGGLAGGRDDPGVATGGGPGIAYRDLGDGRLAAGARRPAYSSNPPTSGAHLRAAVARNGAPISDDQLLTALAAGNVVMMYSSAAPPAGLQAIADSVAPRFSAALADSGQAVILARRAGVRGIVAAAWGRLEPTTSAPALRGFAQYWIGRGAPSGPPR